MFEFSQFSGPTTVDMVKLQCAFVRESAPRTGVAKEIEDLLPQFGTGAYLVRLMLLNRGGTANTGTMYLPVSSLILDPVLLIPAPSILPFLRGQPVAAVAVPPPPTMQAWAALTGTLLGR